MNKKFSVTGMSCSACSASVEKSVIKLKGVESVNVNLLSNSMNVEYHSDIISEDNIINAVVEAGFGASVFSFNVNKELEDEIKKMKHSLIVSIIFLIPLMYLSMGHMLNFPLPSFFHGDSNKLFFAFTQLFLSLPIVYVNKKYYSIGFKTLFKGHPNMDSLIAISTSAAIIYGLFEIYKIRYGLLNGSYFMELYFESAATILTLITFGKFLEVKAKGKTSEAIRKLIDLAPKTALVYREGKEVEILVEDVVINDRIIVKPGQRIPVDGIILEGSSYVDESALTGESIPSEKKIGDKVMAATINKNGFFIFKAEKVGKDTTISQIIELVQEASSSKAPISKLADKISGIFVPVVIVISFITIIIWFALGESFGFSLSMGISVLVISCPCALGLATPVAIMVGTGKGASNGVLIKSAIALETLHDINTIILDKTGTITEGKPVVTDIFISQDISEKRFLQISASIEKPSEHPLADAIIEKANKEGIEIKSVDEFNSLTGRGIGAKLEGKTYFSGNLSLMNELDIDVSEFQGVYEKLSREGKTILYFAMKNKSIGIIAVADLIKPNSNNAISNFKAMGIEVVMITGDNRIVAEGISKQLNIEKVIAEVLPQDKEKEVRDIQNNGNKVAMIGDGINDAPALTRADVGIAIGAGSDIAIDSADIILIRGDLIDVVYAIKLSKATIKNIKQNLFWAFFYNTLGIPLSAGLFYPFIGLKLNPMFAAAAMSLSSLFVVTNALRLRRFKPKF